ncbi:hypothetical protein GCM10010174_61550 [Kutzneria viridogrisea]|uniref:Phage portal protein n=1 Tax=Kutzneria viridogrisea TaxID=47990 RepID=A0ABR6BGB5_9PSEU|nr:hypothetical protein [Kutzneria viridogrisea]
MLADATTPGSPDWWLLRLGRALAEDRPRLDTLHSYWVGDHPLPYGNRKMREAYKRLQRQARSNYAGLVAETILERIKVLGFRSGSSSGSRLIGASNAAAVADQTDQDAWRWWQHNRMDANSGLVHRAAVVMSRAYVIVWPQPRTAADQEPMPLVTGEDPRYVIHESDPTDRYKVRAALKVWRDDVEQRDLAVVSLPDSIHYYRSTQAMTHDQRPWQPQKWMTDTPDYAPDGTADNPFGEVPVVPFLCRPDLYGRALGEFEDVTDIQDRINTVVLDRLVISAMQAYRQRWAKGVDLEDENGNVQSVFDPGADLLWAVPSENAAFGEFNATDLTPLIKAIESDVTHLAAITRTPPHYLIGAMVNVSGDALAAAETGLVSKVQEREQEFGESWEAVYRLAGKVQGREVPDDAEVIWRDPQFRTLTELASASVQLMTAGVPWRTRMEMLGKTPTEIDRMETERAHDALLSSSLASLSVAEGGELGSRGVAFAPKGGPVDSGATPASIPGAGRPGGKPKTSPPALPSGQ